MYEAVLRANSLQHPKLIAHRGFASFAPQNSLPAFRAAGERGFWAIETDVRRTADGILVCCHDSTVDLMFEGTGEIQRMTWDEIRRLHFHAGEDAGAMPTFREYLSVCKEYGCIPFIETKTEDIREVLDSACEFFSEDEFIVSSIIYSHLQTVRKLSEKIFIHHIFSNMDKAMALATLGHCGISFNYTDYHAFPRELLERAHGLGVQVCLRAGDTPQAVRDMIQMGLDYIPTNCVASL